ncbi:chromatin remodelling complex Rsc7/Swp82 subunit-domain-containing protein [Phascolomyces articulosus]|uniref:Chromatin remodelling complex Rsc7/Swp82 subunit-domain-containing protein n=1 Tax=Phascolomyces articulosus TaxID=60185 RepID=A0AAD5P8K4_9FUNG|nr:chromatin remodelling complex Rsc7/Swp82 subunit-domain-containing protein [Phascolomyces articulosus]
MPARDSSAGRRRRGRPPRRRATGRSTSVEDVSPDRTDEAEEQNASESEPEEQLPRMRLRRRGRPPKRGITSSDAESSQTAANNDRKRRREAKKEPTPEEEENEEEEEEEEEQPEEESDDNSDIDEAGETKVDKQGRLLGGRQYKVATFSLPMRGDQVLMFAMDPARQLNFRDSYLFFHKNPILERIRLTEEERNWLVDQKLLVHWFRNRDVAVVSARSCFKCFGSRIIKRGKRVRDDYFEAHAREMGYTEELEDPDEESETEGTAGASGTGTSEKGDRGAATGSGKDKDNKTGRRTLISRTLRPSAFDATTPVNNSTWMHHAALAVGGFNAQLHERRAEKSVFYDIHTNVHQIPSATQPTRVQFECVDNKKDEFSVEEMQFEKTPASAYRGVGRELLDGTYDIEAALRAVPDLAKKSAKVLLSVKPSYASSSTTTKKNANLDEEDDAQYPIALMEGQYQSAFPVHLTRFSQNNPKIAPPSALAATAQSLFAQQHYFNQMYHVMNQNISTMGEQVPPQMQQQHPSPPQMSRPPYSHAVPQNVSPGQISLPPGYSQQHHPQPQSQPQSQPPPQQHQHYICGYQSSKGQICRRAVMFPGEKCQYHAHYYAASRQPHGPHQGQPLMTTIPPQQPQPQQQQQQQPHPQRVQLQQPQPPPPAPTLAENKCAECHYLSAPSELLTKDNACDAFSMIKCSKCTRKHHPVCAHLKTPRQLAAVESYPWACPECKVCCVCKSAGDESTLMICDDCDRGWHTGCCNPKVEKVPEGAWLCPLCADCHGCDEQGDKTEYFHALAPPPTDKIKYPVYLATYCGKCYDNFKNDRFCPCCLKTFSEEDENDDEENEMVACDSCDHWIHTGCDETLTPEKYQSLCEDEEAKYTCPLCADSIKPIHQTNAATLALKGQSQPSGYCVGIVGGKIKARGVVRYKDHKVAVPEIKGTGIAEMPSNKE